MFQTRWDGSKETPGTSRKAHLFHLFVFFFLFISRSLSNCKASFWHKLYQGVKCHESSLASCYHPHLSTVVSCILIKFTRLIICIPTFFCFHLSFAQHPNFFSLIRVVTSKSLSMTFVFLLWTGAATISRLIDQSAERKAVSFLNVRIFIANSKLRIFVFFGQLVGEKEAIWRRHFV